MLCYKSVYILFLFIEHFIVMGLTVLKAKCMIKNLPNQNIKMESNEIADVVKTDVNGEKRHKSAKNTLSQVISFNEHGFFLCHPTKEHNTHTRKRKTLCFSQNMYTTNLRDEYIMAK